MHKVFLDSDVVISSLISAKGASYLLINQASVKLFISNLSEKEILIVCARLNLNKVKFRSMTKKKIKVIKLGIDNDKAKIKYQKYVKDASDSHIIAGAVESGADFLLTFNSKHFNSNKIKEQFKIRLLTPGSYLQYLRSKV